MLKVPAAGQLAVRRAAAAARGTGAPATHRRAAAVDAARRTAGRATAGDGATRDAPVAHRRRGVGHRRRRRDRPRTTDGDGRRPPATRAEARPRRAPAKRAGPLVLAGRSRGSWPCRSAS